MPKKTSSRLFFAIVIFVVLLALAPETRKTIRSFIVKGIANLLIILEQVGIITASLVKRQEELSKTADNAVVKSADSEGPMPRAAGEENREMHGEDHKSPPATANEPAMTNSATAGTSLSSS